MTFLEPVATHGPRANAAGESIPCVGRRAPYVPEEVPVCVLDRRVPKCGDQPRPEWWVTGAHRFQRQGGPDHQDFVRAAVELGEFNSKTLRERLRCANTTARRWFRKQNALGRIAQIGTGRYRWVGEVAA